MKNNWRHSDTDFCLHNIYIYTYATLKERTKWTPTQIIRLLNVCIEETHFYDYQGNIWTQTDGLAIGKSISGALTDIYMNWDEREYTFNPLRNKFIPFCSAF